MERYNSYKDSGVKWIGDVPSHWGICPLRQFLTTFSTKNRPDMPLLSVTREKGVIVRGERGKDDNNNVIPEDLSNYKYAQPGDFIINKMKAWQGSYGLSQYEGIVSPAYFTYHLTSVNPEFFSFALRSKAYIPFFMQNSKGIRVDQWDLVPEAMKIIPFILPTKDEQKVIVSFLTNALTKIDEAIAAQQRMIDLLNERKQIIITRAVTRGLKPDVKLKDSGNDWLGEIPEHWDIKRFKYLFNTRTGLSFTKEQLVEEGEPVISYGQIHSKNNYFSSVNPALIKYIPAALTVHKENTLAYAGDFLFADTSEDFEGCGNNMHIDTEFPIYTGSHTILARKNHNECGSYLAYLFASYKWRGQLRSSVNGVKVYSVTQTILKSALVLLPPKEEQQQIANYLNQRMIIIDKLIAKIKQSIEKFQERKQIIISEVVTGKVKVS